MSWVPDLPNTSIASAARTVGSFTRLIASAKSLNCRSGLRWFRSLTVRPSSRSVSTAASLPLAASTTTFDILRSPFSSPSRSVPDCLAA
jgi:hypothetical protein